MMIIMMILMMIMITMSHDNDKDTDDENDQKNDSYTAAAGAPGASVPCSLFWFLWSWPFGPGPLVLALWSGPLGPRPLVLADYGSGSRSPSTGTPKEGEGKGPRLPYRHVTKYETVSATKESSHSPMGRRIWGHRYVFLFSRACLGKTRPRSTREAAHTMQPLSTI